MDARTKLIIRQTLTLAAMVLFLANYPTTPVMAAAPSCDSFCGSGADCDAACEYWVGENIAFTTCGEYDGGPANGWCDGDSCDTLCGPFAPPERECWSDDQATDCDVFGSHVECGDGYCALGTTSETCSTCSTDCGTCPTTTCGANGCEAGETFRSCPTDCSPTYGSCPNGVCDSGEDGDTCPADCLWSGDLKQYGSGSCPSGWEPVGYGCRWVDALYVCCDQNAGGISMCNVGQKCLRDQGPFPDCDAICK